MGNHSRDRLASSWLRAATRARRKLAPVAGAGALALLLAGPALAVPKVPPGFVVEDFGSTTVFESPTSICPLPDGRLMVGEQDGRVYLIAPGGTMSQPIWSATDEVLNSLEAGLVGLAVDPDFAINRYLYFFYAVDPDSNGIDEESGTWGRLTRYRLGPEPNPTVVPASRTVLLGASWADGPLTGNNTHTVGSLRWGADGSLLISAGDGDDWGALDAGGLYPHVFEPGRADPAEDIGAWRSQSISSLSGKILRIDPATGLGLPSNPFYDGNPASKRSRVWAYGLRNPYRFTVRPGTGDTESMHGDPGVLFVGDVGWYNWEELDVVDQPGLNFGWPAFEGLLPQAEYVETTPFRLGPDSIGTTPDDPRPASPPTSTWNHGVASAGVPPGFTGGATVGGVFYTGTRYPPQYRGRYFHADYGQGGGWIRVATVTPDHRIVSFDGFGTTMDAPVELAIDPLTGDVLYVSYFLGVVRRIRWTGASGGDAPPVAWGRATPMLGVAPLEVELMATGSFDPEGGPVSFLWDFGDGSTSTQADPIHRYTAPGSYLAKLVVTDAFGASDEDTFTVTVTSTPVLPTTGVLDDFDRPDGPLTGSWSGEATGLSIVNGELLHHPGDCRLVWTGAVFASAQEAWVEIGERIADATRVGLLLKVQGLESGDARIEVSYHPDVGSVLVATHDNAFGKMSRGAPIPVWFQPGDRFGARVVDGNRVEVFRNGSRLAIRSITGWPEAGVTGRIGLWLETPLPIQTAKRKADLGGARRASPDAQTGLRYPQPAIPDDQQVGLVDDFGGGDVFVPGNRAPVADIEGPADSSFFDGVSSVTLTAAPTDVEDPPASLTAAWTVWRHHTNRVDAGVAYAGTSVTFTPLDPGEEAGTWYEIRLIVQDTESLADTSTIAIYPASDLEPTGLVTNASHLPPGTPAAIEFSIANHGPLVSSRSFYRVLLDQISLETEPVTVPGGGSFRVHVPVPGGMTPGPHRIRVVADTLRQAVETDETNNVLVLEFEVGGENVGVGPPLPRVLAVSPAAPNPTRGAVVLAIDLPVAAAVDLEILDLQGRQVFAESRGRLAAGRWSLGWDGRTAGRRAPPGVYLARVRVGDATFFRRIAVLR